MCEASHDAPAYVNILCNVKFVGHISLQTLSFPYSEGILNPLALEVQGQYHDAGPSHLKTSHFHFTVNLVCLDPPPISASSLRIHGYLFSGHKTKCSRE